MHEHSDLLVFAHTIHWWALGFMALYVPEEDCGIGLNRLDSSLIIEELADYYKSKLQEAFPDLEIEAATDEDSAQQDSFMQGLLDCPHYTRPEHYRDKPVPDVLLSGDHERIRRWRLKQALGRTWQRRPELLDALELSTEQQALLNEVISEYESGN